MNTCFTALYIFPLDSDEREKKEERERVKYRIEEKKIEERGVCLVCTSMFDHVVIVS